MRWSKDIESIFSLAPPYCCFSKGPCDGAGGEGAERQRCRLKRRSPLGSPCHGHWSHSWWVPRVDDTALPRAVVCGCGSTSWLCIAQRHRGSPSAKASSLQNTCLHKLHFPHLSSVSSKLIFLSCNIHVWSSHSNKEVQWHITLFVHCQSYHVTYSNIFHLESRSSFSFASRCIVLFLPLLPHALPC